MTEWRIELGYDGMAGFTTHQQGPLSDAIENAIYVAHAAGWPLIPSRKRAVEVTQEKANGRAAYSQDHHECH